MSPFAERVQRDLDQRYAELWDAHEAGEHADDPEQDCNGCARDAREALNVEGDPTRNGAWTVGADGYVREPLTNRGAS